MWWQYAVTFAGSLIVALLSVWIAQSWSAKRERSKALGNLKSEVSANIRDCKLISEWLDKDFDALTKGEGALTPYPRLHDSAWYLVRSTFIGDYALVAKLEDAYRLIAVVNNLLQRIEELRYTHMNEYAKGFTLEALEQGGLKITERMRTVALALSADRETAYRTNYTHHIAAAKGYTQKLLTLLEEVEPQVAELCASQKDTNTAVLDKRLLKSKAALHIGFAAVLLGTLPFLTGGYQIALIVVMAILTFSSSVLYFCDRFSFALWMKLVSISANIEVSLTVSGFGLSNVGINLIRVGWWQFGIPFLVIGGLLLGFGIGANLKRIMR